MASNPKGYPAKKKGKQPLSKKVIMLIAAEWNKDIRTVRRWEKDNDPMLTHPKTIEIINTNK